MCGKHLTVGVMHRVDQLASLNPKLQMINDQNGVKWIGYEDRPPYAMLVPLQEIIAESLGSRPARIKVQSEYEKLTAPLRQGFVGQGEFGGLLTMPISEIAKSAGEKVAEVIKKVRAGEINIDPGYDGVFGVVKIWPPSVPMSIGTSAGQGVDKNSNSQISMF